MGAKRAAAVDVGTNSFLLLILERDTDGAERVVLDRSDITRLGQGVDAARRLQPEAIARGLEQLALYRRLIDEHGVSAVRAVGTSALRDAANRDQFITPAAGLGIPVEVISGEREAELAFAAVAAEHAGAELLNLDIGGGSTELVQGRSGRIAWRRSLDIGAVRLTDRWGPMADPPTAAELACCQALAAEHLTTVEPTQAMVVGTGGTITTLAAVHHGLTAYDAATVTATRLTPAVVAALIARLAAVPLAERRRIAGLPPKRADVILAGAVLLAEVLGRLRVAEMGVSAGGLRFALAREVLAAG
jgi:exopolyphosphatase/guanosine-5'-triphosphate,3'-diphosphate pyrophosphatase